jgi:hypothetical protein
VRAAAHLFEVRPAVAFRPQKEVILNTAYLAPNPPYGATLWYYLRDTPAQAPKLTITDRMGRAVASLAAPAQPGLQRVVWDLRSETDPGAPVAPGEYVARLQIGGVTLERPVRVEAEE